jgi:tRNA threonylcarbamoyladenosine biosynthesis protein TsaE
VPTVVTTHSAAETATAARELASSLKADAVVLLAGDLGAGKTVFVKGLAEGLGVSPDEVTSPTFTLVQEYRGGRLPLVHADLYRLQAVEVDDLGLDELARGGILAIEWPDRLPRTIHGAVRVTIEHRGDETTRTLQIDWP